MKKEIEISAKTKEEAIAKAVEALGAPNEKALFITVVREARKGFLGFGAVDATIKAVYQVPDAAPAGEAFDRPRRDGGRAPKRSTPAKAVASEASARAEAHAETPAEAPAVAREQSPAAPAEVPAAADEAAVAAAAPANTRTSQPAKNTKSAPKETAPRERVKPANIDPSTATESEQNAYRFITKLVENMELQDVKIGMHPGSNDDMVITVDGESAGVLIGHHGDTLDALQYLANLAANRKEEGEKREYARITVDVEDYRAKREEALRILARKKASQVLKYKTSIMLEPMNPYERRIIHSEIQHMEGVSTNSIGAENNRRVVIYLEADGMSTANLRGAAVKGSAPAADKPSGSSRSRRRRKPKSAAADPFATATQRTPQPSLFDENDAHDPFDIDLSAALPSEDSSEE